MLATEVVCGSFPRPYVMLADLSHLHVITLLRCTFGHIVRNPVDESYLFSKAVTVKLPDNIFGAWVSVLFFKVTSGDLVFSQGPIEKTSQSHGLAFGIFWWVEMVDTLPHID